MGPHKFSPPFQMTFSVKKLTDLVCNISTISATIRETWRGVDMAKLAEAEDLPNKYRDHYRHIDSGEVILASRWVRA